MVVTDTTQSYAEIVVGVQGTDNWQRMYGVQVNGPFFGGEEITVKGKLQGSNKSGQNFDIEYRIGLFAYLDQIPAAAQVGTLGCIHPITGENIGPYNEVTGKYCVLEEDFTYIVPGPCSYVWFDLRASARSTAAVATTRLAFGNGFLQAAF